jgi:hypothetical protein
MRNVVPFKAPDAFKRYGIDWTREPATEGERSLREAYLTYETSCGLDGLVSVVLLSLVSRRQGAVASDLQAAADFGEGLLVTKLHKHQDDALHLVRAHVGAGGHLWS